MPRSCSREEVPGLAGMVLRRISRGAVPGLAGRALRLHLRDSASMRGDATSTVSGAWQQRASKLLLASVGRDGKTLLERDGEIALAGVSGVRGVVHLKRGAALVGCATSLLLGHTSCPNAAGRTAAGLAAREDAIDEEKRGTWNGTPVLTWEARDPSLGDPTVPGALEPIASELDSDSRPGERGLPMFAEPHGEEKGDADSGGSGGSGVAAGDGSGGDGGCGVCACTVEVGALFRDTGAGEGGDGPGTGGEACCPNTVARTTSISLCDIPDGDSTWMVKHVWCTLLTSNGSSSMKTASQPLSPRSCRHRATSCCLEPQPASSNPPRNLESEPIALAESRTSYSVVP